MNATKEKQNLFCNIEYFFYFAVSIVKNKFRRHASAYGVSSVFVQITNVPLYDSLLLAFGYVYISEYLHVFDDNVD